MFQRIWRTLGTDRGFQIAGVICILSYLLYLCIFQFATPWKAHHFALLLTFPLFIAYALCLALRSSWFRPIGCVSMGFLLLIEFWMISQRGFKLTDALAIVGVGYGVWQIWKLDPYEDDESPEESNDEESGSRPMTSLVLLQKELPHLEAVVIARLASQAWGVPVTGSGLEDDAGDAPQSETEEEGGAYVIGQPPIFMCSHPQGMFLLNVFDRPYWEEEAPPKVAEEMRELRARLAIERHTAWLSLDLMAGLDPEDPDQKREAFQIIGSFLAAIADENTLAVLDPEGGQIFVYDPETEAKLKSHDVLAALHEQFYAPVIRIADDDPAMIQAVQEAKNRWPEFVAAFEGRAGDDSPFIIKAPFSEGEKTEFMWLEVTSIENGQIYGVLKSEPADLPSLHEGSRVRVQEADVNDWLCVVDKEALGAFTMKVLAERMKGDENE